MAVEKIRVIFNLDGTGVYYDSREPTALDALVDLMIHPGYVSNELGFGDTPLISDDLPFKRSSINGYDVWHASCIFPVDGIEDVRFKRKKFRLGKVGISTGSFSLIGSQYKEQNIPMLIMACTKMEAYAYGDSGIILSALKKVKAIGRERARGYGRVIDVTIDPIDEDFSLVKNGKAMKHLPDSNGFRSCRVSPPYWIDYQRINVCEIGDEYQLLKKGLSHEASFRHGKKCFD